jgi:hypothetical protein
LIGATQIHSNSFVRFIFSWVALFGAMQTAIKPGL